MRNMIVAAGGSVDDLPDNLPSTLQKRLIETMGGNCPEGNLPSDICNAFGSCGGAQNVVFGEVSGEMATTAAGFAAYVTELVIPEGVTSFNLSKNGADGDIYFHEFENLKKLTLPASFNTNTYQILGYPEGVGTELFSKLEEIIISEGATAIGSGAFEHCEGCNITVYLPSTIETIDESAFQCYAADNYNAANNNLTIIINKPENSIAGAPWAAGYDNNATVIWTG